MRTTVYIQDVYNITGIGVVPVGAVKDGELRIGMKLTINGVVMTLKSIEMHHQSLQVAHVGDNIGFTLQGGNKNLLNQVKGKHVIFSDEVNETTNVASKPVEKKKGFFSFLFGK